VERDGKRDPTAEGVGFTWPRGFKRIPDQEWTAAPIDDMARSYDRVRRHTWYANLDPVVDELEHELRPGDVLMDYSGGTGILIDRLGRRIGDRPVGMLIVDASPKFLRFALEQLREDERVAFRLLAYLRDEKRLETLGEAVEPMIRERGVDAISCTNAIHLYPDLDATLGSWAAVLRSGRRAFINSGNILDPRAPAGEWIIDTTVDRERMAAHAAYRERVFLPPRPLERYLAALAHAGFTVEDAHALTIYARVADWYEFLRTYDDAVLGWIGGSPKIDGRTPDSDARRDRHELLRRSLDELFGGAETFPCRWTFIRARR
jgi:ubiquinone/menaquinone biosynthesis C-methylase UbiE